MCAFNKLKKDQVEKSFILFKFYWILSFDFHCFFFVFSHFIFFTIKSKLISNKYLFVIVELFMCTQSKYLLICSNRNSISFTEEKKRPEIKCRMICVCFGWKEMWSDVIPQIYFDSSERACAKSIIKNVYLQHMCNKEYWIDVIACGFVCVTWLHHA